MSVCFNAFAREKGLSRYCFLQVRQSEAAHAAGGGGGGLFGRMLNR
jgi:hypothetical protein